MQLSAPISAVKLYANNMPGILCRKEKSNFKLGKRNLMHNSGRPKSPCKGPLLHMQPHKERSHTLNTGYCNWNKVQGDDDLTPFWPVTLPLLSLSYFSFFAFSFSLSFFSLAWSRSKVCADKHKPHKHTLWHPNVVLFFFTIFSFSSTSFHLQR